MHQPGIMPLRPLTLGDIFGGALQTMRRNPEATIGMGFIVLAVLLVPSFLGSLLLTQGLTNLAEADLNLITMLINVLFSTLSSVALTGMIMHVVGEAVLGDRAGLSATWRAVKGRIPALIGTVLLLSLLGVVVLAVTVAVVLGIVFASLGAGDAGWVGFLLLVPLGLGLVVLIVWLSARVSLAPGAVVLERLGPWRGITRAWSLTRGLQGWRIAGITVLAGLLVGIFTMIVTLPISLGVFFAMSSAGMSTAPVAPAILATDHLTQLVVGAITIPFTAGVTALLYLDQRIRREGLDVTLARAAQDRAAARQG